MCVNGFKKIVDTYFDKNVHKWLCEAMDIKSPSDNNEDLQ
jgi:hypothetical protein